MISILENSLHDEEAWDEFVKSTNGSNFCHLGPWRKVIRDSYNLNSKLTFRH